MGVENEVETRFVYVTGCTVVAYRFSSVRRLCVGLEV